MLNLLFSPCLFLPLSLSFHLCCSCTLLIRCLHAAFFLFFCYFSCIPVFCSVWPLFSREYVAIAPDEERLVLLKPVVQFSLTYDESRGILTFVYMSVNSDLRYSLYCWRQYKIYCPYFRVIRWQALKILIFMMGITVPIWYHEVLYRAQDDETYLQYLFSHTSSVTISEQ